MNKLRFAFSVKGNFIRGQFQLVRSQSGEWVSRSPGDFSDELGRFSYSYESIDDAVRAAREAQPAWRRQKQIQRADLLKKYKECLSRREAELCEAMAREVGKPIWEARVELNDLIHQIDATLADGTKHIADFEIEELSKRSRGVCRHKPLGVVAVIGPVTQPLLLPNNQIVPALLTGNTVVFKPSEKASLVGQLIAECILEAGFPPGVFNLVQGEREVGRRLCVHEGVDGVLFTGSNETGTRIKQDTLQQHWKLVALEMGGKNSAIVWGDAKLDFAIQETLAGAFISAGQRCSSTSRIIVQRKIFDEFMSQFHQRSKAFSIGNPMDNVFMGPLIEQGAVDRYMKFLGIAVREGGEVVMRGKSFDMPVQGNYVTPSICWVKDSSIDAARKSVYQQTEFSAPNVALIPVDEIEQAIGLVNVTQYGLVTSVFTQDRSLFEKCVEELQSGLIHLNKSTTGASARLPYGGLKKSGNHFPGGIFAIRYCTLPVASIELDEPHVDSNEYPGLGVSS